MDWPGYKSLPRIREEELRQDRERESPDDGLDQARDLDADEVERRAARRRERRAVALHPDDAGRAREIGGAAGRPDGGAGTAR
jgi:hypothetical protein